MWRKQINMAAKDLYHDLVKEALIQYGWKITHDPLHLRFFDENTITIEKWIN